MIDNKIGTTTDNFIKSPDDILSRTRHVYVEHSRYGLHLRYARLRAGLHTILKIPDRSW
jgi:hypothetical protein